MFILREGGAVMFETYVGKIVLYHHPKMPDASPAIVTRVLPGSLINATVFTDSGRTFPVYGVPALLIPGTTAPHWTLTEGEQHG